MKRKLFSTLFALVLVLSFSLVTALPVAAATAVTDVYVDFPYLDTQNDVSDSGTNEYLVHFKPTVALVRGVDWVTVTFPDGTSTMGPAAFTVGAVAAADATFSTNYGTAFDTDATWVASSSAATVSGYRVKVKAPIDVAAGADVWLSIDSTGIVAPSNVANNYKVYVQTTKDTTRVISSDFSLDSTVISGEGDVVTVATPTAGVASEYKFAFTTASAQQSTVTVKFAVGTVLPSEISADELLFSLDDSTYVVSGSTPVVDVARRTVTAQSSVTFTGDSVDYMKIIVAAGIINPTTIQNANVYRAMIKTNIDAQWAYMDESTAIVAGTATKLAFTTTSDNATILNAFTQVLTLQSQDVNGNLKAAALTTTVLVTTDGTGTVHTAAGGSGDLWGASQTHGSGTDDVFYRPTAVGTHTLTASVVSGDTLTAATIDITVAPAVVLTDSVGNTIGTYGPATSLYTADLMGGTYIQNAINAAAAGDTVALGTGIYELSSAITLDEKITLAAASGASPILRPTDEMDKAIDVTTSGDSTNAVIIDGLTFTRLRLTKEFDVAIGSTHRSYLTIRNNTFNYIIPDASGTTEAVVWFLYGNSAVSNITVSNNTFNNCVAFRGISGGAGSTGNIQFYDAGGAQALTAVTVSGNTITDCNDYGIAIGGSAATTVTISNNTITNGYQAICLADKMTAATITGNTITDAYDYAIHAEGDNNTLVTIKNNTITGTAGTFAVKVEEAQAVCTIQYNHFSGNNGYDIQSTGVAQDCKYNWYGSASGPVLLTDVSTLVTYSPWLHKSLADVVAANASYPTVSRSLAVGWNTLSTPAKLISSVDAINELVPAGMTIAYKYDSVLGWVQVTTDVLNPLDAFYVKMSSAQTVLLKVDGAAFSAPTKSLAAGWNLIGLASLTSQSDEAAVASLTSTSFGQLVSPSMNASEWIYVSGSATNTLAVGEGYWIFMTSSATLGGFTILPIAPSLT